MEPHGRGNKEILIVGEAPVEEDDENGIQFTGRDGRLLSDTLNSVGIDMRKQCWTTNALICKPNGKVADAENKKRIPYCRPNLMNTIKSLNPRIIILLGQSSVESLIGHLWKDKVGTMKRWAGWRIPHQGLNTWICPTFHPSYVSWIDDKVIDREFKEHIEAACKLKGRPWGEKGPPNFSKKIKIILNDAEALNYLRDIKDGDTIAFDFESDRLKPDHPKAELVSCSVCCNGKWTIAFPWYGFVIQAMKDILRNPKIGKIASNLKHEHRWCKRVLGYAVKGWNWDTMLAGHTLDPRGRISSIKFQSFVRLGNEDYSHHIQPFLETKGGNKRNRIKDIDLNSLLLYNGYDSLWEYMVSDLQKAEFNDSRIN